MMCSIQANPRHLYCKPFANCSWGCIITVNLQDQGPLQSHPGGKSSSLQHTQSILSITICRFRKAFLSMSPATYKISKVWFSHLWNFSTGPLYQKDAHRKMTQIGVIGSSRTLTGSRLATKPILAKSVIWLAGNSQKCHPPNIKKPNIQKWLYVSLLLHCAA